MKRQKASRASEPAKPKTIEPAPRAISPTVIVGRAPSRATIAAASGAQTRVPAGWAAKSSPTCSWLSPS